MPLPWKKNRVPRISQIVADLQSPKRGGSLVVETGFPTSLIDLFVKNRSRFKKRKSTNKRSDPPAVPPAPPPSPPEPSSSKDCLEVCAESDAEAASLRRLVSETVHEDDAVAALGRGNDRVGECVGGSNADMVVAAILKVFAVIALTLSAKKLTVGITMSAFALLFLEYVGKHIVCCLNLKPCSNANMVVRSSVQRVSSSFWFQKIAFKRRKNCEGSEQEAIVHEGEAVVSGMVELCSASSSIIEEVKVVEAKGDTNIRCEVTNFDKKWVYPLMEDGSKGKVVEQCEISEWTTKGKRCAKFKSKMVRILVPKKLRASKKEKKNKNKGAESNNEVSSTIGGDKSARFGIEEEQDKGNTAPLVLSNKLECIMDGEADHGITRSNDSLLVKEVAVGVSGIDEEGRRIVYNAGSSGYIILILIALAGLVGGRIPALLFTMAWCFILKMVRTRGRSVNGSTNLLVEH